MLNGIATSLAAGFAVAFAMSGYVWPAATMTAAAVFGLSATINNRS